MGLGNMLIVSLCSKLLILTVPGRCNDFGERAVRGEAPTVPFLQNSTTLNLLTFGVVQHTSPNMYEMGRG